LIYLINELVNHFDAKFIHDVLHRPTGDMEVKLHAFQTVVLWNSAVSFNHRPLCPRERTHGTY